MVARIGLAEIKVCARANILSVEHRATGRVRADGFASGGHVRPRRKHSGGAWKRRAGSPKRNHQRKRKAAAGGVARDDNCLWRMAFCEKAVIDSDRVVHSSGKWVFWREAIVWREHAESVPRKPNGNGTVRLCGTAEIASAMQIEQDGFGRIRRFDPLAGNAVQAGRSHTHGGRDPVWKGPKNCTRDTIVATAFEAALNTPFGKPDGEVRLKASHEGLRLRS